MSNAEVILAEQALETARKRERAERRTKLIAELKEVRAELRTKRKAYALLEKKVLQGQAALDSIYSSQMAIFDARGRLQSIRPEVADYLPNDESVIEWNSNINALDERLAKLREARSKLPNVQLLRMEGVQTHGIIQSLEWRETQILNECQNALAQVRVGGVHGVA
jgi:chromosome segregation ATPase